jgi:hypothetical protein
MAAKFFVVAVDRFMSGWGLASGKRNVIVFKCETYAEAERIELRLRARSEMSRVRVNSTPYRAKRGDLVSLKTKATAPSWYAPTRGPIAED